MGLLERFLITGKDEKSVPEPWTAQLMKMLQNIDTSAAYHDIEEISWTAGQAMALVRQHEADTSKIATSSASEKPSSLEQAAPELLEALKEAVKVMDKHSHKFSEEDHDRLDSCLAAIKAVS